MRWLRDKWSQFTRWVGDHTSKADDYMNELENLQGSDPFGHPPGDQFSRPNDPMGSEQTGFTDKITISSFMSVFEGMLTYLEQSEVGKVWNSIEGYIDNKQAVAGDVEKNNALVSKVSNVLFIGGLVWAGYQIVKTLFFSKK